MVKAPAIFASAFHPHVGGVEELTRQLAHEQLTRGVVPLVVTNRYPKDLPSREQYQGIDVVRVPFRVPEPTTRQLGGWALYAAATQRELRRELEHRGTDLVHVQCVSSNGRYALRAARTLRLPLVVTMQGELTMDATGVYQRSAQLRATWRALLDRAEVVTGCSEHVLAEAERAYGRSFGGRARVIYNGISLAEFSATEPARRERPFVLGIGRLVPQKGFDLLIDAFERVSTLRPELELVIAGSGGQRAALERHARGGSVAERVRFVGNVSHEQAVGLFLAAEVFVLPSRHEPQGIVVLEAMAAGTPVVAARVGGVPEIVQDGRNGLTFAGGDVDDLSERLGAVLVDDALRVALREQGLRTAARFDWSQVVDQYDACYATAAA